MSSSQGQGHRPITYVIGTSMVGSTVIDGRPTLIFPISLPRVLPSAEFPLIVERSVQIELRKGE